MRRGCDRPLASLPLALGLGLALLLPGPVDARDRRSRPFTTLEKLWKAPADQVRARLQIEPMDPGAEPDRALIELMWDIEENQVSDLLLRIMALETPLNWSRVGGSFVHPEVGVWIDRRFAAAARQAAERPRLREVLRYLLAHQLAHSMQLRAYTLESVTRPEQQDRLEAQAELLTGITLMQNHIFTRRAWPIPTDLENSIQYSRRFDSSNDIPHKRLPDELRRALLRIGVEAGNYYAHVWTCVTNIGEPGNYHVMTGTRKAIKRTRDHVDEVFATRSPKSAVFPPRPDDLELPRFDPATCESEEVFDWTSRAAQFVLEAWPPAQLPAR